MDVYVCMHLCQVCKFKYVHAISVAHFVLIHAFFPFLYAAHCLDMKRAILIGDCFLCRFCSTLPHQEFTENNDSMEQ